MVACKTSALFLSVCSQKLNKKLIKVKYQWKMVTLVCPIQIFPSCASAISFC
ncbi:hypothetical protein D3C71_2109710 [compost metagenome]